MKQGRASYTSMDAKTEPKPRAVSPGGVDQLGQATAFKKDNIYEGRGLKAPMVGQTNHKAGSQGRH